jgi:hypothetical protein
VEANSPRQRPGLTASSRSTGCPGSGRLCATTVVAGLVPEPRLRGGPRGRGTAPRARGQAPLLPGLRGGRTAGMGDAEAHYQFGIVLFRRSSMRGQFGEFEGRRVRPTPVPSTIWRWAGLKPSRRSRLSERAAVNDDGHLRLVPRLQLALPSQTEAPRENRSHLDRGGPAADEPGVSYERDEAEPGARAIPGRSRGCRAGPRPPGSGSVLDLRVYYLLATVYAAWGSRDLAHKYAELSRTTRSRPD